MRCNLLRALAILLVGLGVVLTASAAQAQYSQVTSPFNTLNDSFFENFGVGFGFNIPTRMPAPGHSGVVGLGPTGLINPNAITYGGIPSNATPPPFGGYDPNGNANIGLGFLGNGFNGFLNLNASQGSNRSNISQTPTVVIPNGGQGTVIDTTQVPFVTGLIPVVGGASFSPPMQAFAPGPPISPLYERMNRLQQMRDAGLDPFQRHTPVNAGGGGGNSGLPSTANRGDLSVAEIRAQQAAAGNQPDRELAELIERGRGAEDAGKLSVAKHYYRMAAQRAEGSQKRELLDKVQVLEGTK